MRLSLSCCASGVLLAPANLSCIVAVLLLMLLPPAHLSCIIAVSLLLLPTSAYPCCIIAALLLLHPPLLHCCCRCCCCCCHQLSFLHPGVVAVFPLVPLLLLPPACPTCIVAVLAAAAAATSPSGIIASLLGCCCHLAPPPASLQCCCRHQPMFLCILTRNRYCCLHQLTVHLHTTPELAAADCHSALRELLCRPPSLCCMSCAALLHGIDFLLTFLYINYMTWQLLGVLAQIPAAPPSTNEVGKHACPEWGK